MKKSDISVDLRRENYRSGSIKTRRGKGIIIPESIPYFRAG